MKFTILPFLGLATTALADSLYVAEVCLAFTCSRSGTFTTSVGSYVVNAGNGCRGTSVPGMTEFCMDWNRDTPRGHFRFSHQNNKRCLIFRDTNYYSCGGINTCWETRFTEGPCTWREPGGDDDDEEVATASAISAEAEATAEVEAGVDPVGEDKMTPPDEKERRLRWRA